MMTLQSRKCIVQAAKTYLEQLEWWEKSTKGPLSTGLTTWIFVDLCRVIGIEIGLSPVSFYEDFKEYQGSASGKQFIRNCFSYIKKLKRGKA